MGLRGCNVVGPHSAGGIGFWGEKKGECALTYIAESLCMDRQYGESAGGNSLYIMHHLRSDFRFFCLVGDGEFGNCWLAYYRQLPRIPPNPSAFFFPSACFDFRINASASAKILVKWPPQHGQNGGEPIKQKVLLQI